jgi:BolA family transcriptional regulator, general stress-responsive regulator
MNEKEMNERLEQQFSPSYLKLIDQSHTHTPDQHVEEMKKTERLYELFIVSDAFKGMSLLRRHQAIYKALNVGTNEAIHGITIHAYSPVEWAKIENSP